jgi:hypothetical protein
MHELNLTLPEWRRPPPKRGLGLSVVVALAVWAVLCCVSSVPAFVQERKSQAEARYWNGIASRLDARRGELDAALQEGTFQGEGRRWVWSDFLVELSERIPRGVILERFQADGAKRELRLGGEADEPADLDRFVQVLRRAPGVAAAEASEQLTPHGAIRFEVTCGLAP